MLRQRTFQGGHRIAALVMAWALFNGATHALAAPTVSITTPADNSIQETLAAVEGTAAPSAGQTLSLVEVVLRRLVSGTSDTFEFWNGGAWHTGLTSAD